MTRLFLIRHGEPEAAWGGAADDPGLSEAGRSQAEAAAETLAGYGRLAIVSSPMKRCRETAAPFASRSGANALVEPRVSEVVAPPGVADRRAWLRENFPWDEGVVRRQWSGVDPGLRAWRDSVVAAMLELKQDSACVFTFHRHQRARQHGHRQRRYDCVRAGLWVDHRVCRARRRA